MSKNNILTFFDNLVAKAFIAILGVVSAVTGIYAFFQKQKPELRYEIMSNTNVLDFNADLSKLEVIYDSTNLKRTGEDLRVYTIKITNKGDADILKSSFDENDPIGIGIRSGRIIERPEIIRSSSDYIRKNIKIVYYDKQKVNFSQIILESDEFFIVKLLVLHKKKINPELSADGKVAGQKQIAVVSAINSENEDSFLTQTFGGGFSVQMLRSFSYFIAVIVSMFIFILMVERVANYRDRKRKTKLIDNFKKTDTHRRTRMDDALFDTFKNKDAAFLKRIAHLTSDENIINDFYQNSKRVVDKLDSPGSIRVNESVLVKKYIDESTVLNTILNDGLVFKDNEKLSINKTMRETLSRFIIYLEEKGEFKRASIQTEVIPKNDSEVG